MKRCVNMCETRKENCSRRHEQSRALSLVRSISQLDGALQVLLDRIRISVLEVWYFVWYGVVLLHISALFGLTMSEYRMSKIS